VKKALIVSDGRPGHLNQSVALCRHLGMAHETIAVAYKGRPAKALAYLLDRMAIYTETLFAASPRPEAGGFGLVVSAGSATYYANKLLARRLGVPNVAILHPQGFRLDFSHVFCPAYDHPPKRPNVTELPLNLCAADAAFFAGQAAEFRQRHAWQKPAAGVIVGGPNAVSDIAPDAFRRQLEQLFAATGGMERWATTSRRTPRPVERIVESFPFDYLLVNSRDAYNPVPAFIQLCDRLFVTSDSASMISECASFGSAKVEILMNRQLKSPNKFEELVRGLAQHDAVHLFDGALGHADRKIDLGPLLRKKTGSILDGRRDGHYLAARPTGDMRV